MDLCLIRALDQFLVTKLIRRCPAHRTAILQEFRGQVARLLLHRDASRVLADAYELHGIDVASIVSCEYVGIVRSGCL